MISDRILDQITEELSLLNGGASVCVRPLDTLTGTREVTVRDDGTYRVTPYGTVKPHVPYGVYLYDRDWEPEEARG